MPYALKLYLYLFVACVLATVIAARLTPFGLLVNLGCALVAAYPWIIIGRWLFNKPDGLDA